MTTYLSWRFVFAGEVLVVLFILLTVRWIADAPPTGPRRRLDAVGATLSVVGLALVVLGVLQSGAWGWLRPLDPPVTVLGFSPTPFMIAAGLVVLGLLRSWLRRRESRGLDPLIRWGLFDVPSLRAALATLVAQNLILLGLFFRTAVSLVLNGRAAGNISAENQRRIVEAATELGYQPNSAAVSLQLAPSEMHTRRVRR